MSAVDKLMDCPVCLETMLGNIRQCQSGHSICEICVMSNLLTQCPQCRGPMGINRNYQLEQLIKGVQENVTISCPYADKGCKFQFLASKGEAHKKECHFRTYSCEHKNYIRTECTWQGPYKDIVSHFKDHHPTEATMEFNTDTTIPIDLTKTSKHLQVFHYFGGWQVFYLKSKVDVDSQKVFWSFQLVGLAAQAKGYFYEFEISKGPVQKLKVTEFCENDSADVDSTFREETCAVFSFKTIRRYLDEKSGLHIRFRVLKDKSGQDSGADDKGMAQTKGSNVVGPNMADPNMAGPNMAGPNMAGPNMAGPYMGGPHMGGHHMGGPHMGGPHMGGPHMRSPHMAGPHMARGGHTGGFHGPRGPRFVGGPPNTGHPSSQNYPQYPANAQHYPQMPFPPGPMNMPYRGYPLMQHFNSEAGPPTSNVQQSKTKHGKSQSGKPKGEKSRSKKGAPEKTSTEKTSTEKTSTDTTSTEKPSPGKSAASKSPAVQENQIDALGDGFIFSLRD